ncbi:hypothetical protein TNCV_1136601 [Trichonephila clavipes]|nr:hypothetical protein TNCV_1136601 [Trichonephila clavipes]
MTIRKTDGALDDVQKLRLISEVQYVALKVSRKSIRLQNREFKDYIEQIKVLNEKKILTPPSSARFGRCGDITSIPNWSDMTDSSVQPAATTTGLGASPSRVTTGDELIAEKSDLFREAIRARNVYAAWARKLTNARPNDPKLQEFHQEVTKAGESVNSFLTQLDVPLFRIPMTLDVTGKWNA